MLCLFIIIGFILLLNEVSCYELFDSFNETIDSRKLQSNYIPAYTVCYTKSSCNVWNGLSTYNVRMIWSPYGYPYDAPANIWLTFFSS